jgi:hypothetical protein
MTDPHKLTPAEVHAVAAMLSAVEDERWWNRRVEVMTALAKMRAQASRENH